jgi:transcription-repair coupling factor (superfamily II helicase)
MAGVNAAPLRRTLIAGAPEGLDAILVAELARKTPGGVLHIARDDQRLAATADVIRFFAPDVAVLTLPAWDCLPYDRVSPNSDISATRMATLGHLASLGSPGALVVITTVNAALQRLPARKTVADALFSARPGDRLDLGELSIFMERNGYTRASTVMEPGEFAVRGGIVDIFAPDGFEPLRLDLFGDTLETVRVFDPLTQRTTGTRDVANLLPVSEVRLTPEAISRFRASYVELFGPATRSDPLYEAVSAGRKHQGMEHWLPLFQENLETIFDYLPDGAVTIDYLAEDARDSRGAMIEDYYRARENAPDEGALGSPRYKPLPPDRLYLDAAAWDEIIGGRTVQDFSGFQTPDRAAVRDAGGRHGRDFAPERAQPDVNVFDSVRDHINALRNSGKRVLIACYSLGSCERLEGVLRDHDVAQVEMIEHWSELQQADPSITGVTVLPLESGFESGDLAVLSEQDILGDRHTRRPSRSRRAENFLTESSSLSAGDIIVHKDHGIGRFEGLKTIDAAGAPHDCLFLVYHGDDKLYVPVENIDVLSRYSSDMASVQLDKLGGSGWQARKSKLKERIRDMADQLIAIAAARELKSAKPLPPPEGLYQEFCARFPYQETEDQLGAIDDAVQDLSTGKLMDRLVCGDVGFGKTEVALRIAFIAAMDGKQVAIVAPTTLLARQHYKTFTERFAGLPIEIRQLSRLVTTKDASLTREGLASGQVDIVIGTHALLGKNVTFKDLGLLIIDEEQHFGVAHKERLKRLKGDIHVLTLTATPIPRTLQLALSGVRELSLIATPPVDRLAVRTFVLPFDPLVVREAILREHFRGGQSFYVCPRISDLDDAAAFLREEIPEVKFAIAHGQMPPGDIDQIMTAFDDGAYDVLLSTTIIESGLDIPTVNTLIIHRADMYGLAQLYQLRGRVGRSKVRGYAYLTVPPDKALTENAEKRLRVLQTLDTLGAGFSLASHDMDIRGAGNLLGGEQSGHVREVGIELYQEMLEEAVAEARGLGADADGGDGTWTPQINTGAAILIPEGYVPDLSARMALYRRIASLLGRTEIDELAAEMIDRFGSLPDEVQHLLKIVEIKGLCRDASIERIEAGPKGATMTFHNAHFPNPAGLVAFISDQVGTAKLRPDHKLVYMRRWDTPEERLKGVYHMVRELAKIARQSASGAGEGSATEIAASRTAASNT